MLNIYIIEKEADIKNTNQKVKDFDDFVLNDLPVKLFNLYQISDYKIIRKNKIGSYTSKEELENLRTIASDINDKIVELDDNKIWLRHIAWEMQSPDGVHLAHQDGMMIAELENSTTSLYNLQREGFKIEEKQRRLKW